jgi:hypothetical protein
MRENRQRTLDNALQPSGLVIVFWRFRTAGRGCSRGWLEVVDCRVGMREREGAGLTSFRQDGEGCFDVGMDVGEEDLIPVVW